MPYDREEKVERREEKTNRRGRRRGRSKQGTFRN
jgi:hypothetical protein